MIITSDVSLIENDNIIFIKKLTMMLQCFIYDNKYSYSGEDNILIFSIEIINNNTNNNCTNNILDTFIPQCKNINNINPDTNIDISSSINITNSNIITSDNSLIPSSINISEV